MKNEYFWGSRSTRGQYTALAVLCPIRQRSRSDTACLPFASPPFLSWQYLQARCPPTRPHCLDKLLGQSLFAHFLRQPLAIINHRHELDTEVRPRLQQSVPNFGAAI